MRMMKKIALAFTVIAGSALLVASMGSAAVPPDPLGSNPPVFQSLGTLDTVAGLLSEADCRACHDSGVPDRHHMLYGSALPSGTLIPYPHGENIYTCIGCHDDTFTVERDCLQCHNAGSPHHTTDEAFNRQCTACHGDLVDDYNDGHYIPTYSASLVTPWQGLNGDGYFNAPYPTPDLESNGTGAITDADVTQTEAGPPYFSVNPTPLGVLQTRNQPAVLAYKPAGLNNDVVIGSTHHGGEEYSVVFTQGSPLAASWDDGTQTLSVTIAPTQTAQALVDTINAATGAVDVEATLGYDGETPLAPEHYEPIGGDPPNNRGFGAGSCSYCHDHDGALDDNGDPAPVLILNNHDTHHGIGLPLNMSDGAGGTWRRCNVCHNYTDRAAPDPPTYRDQSGPAFDLHIRICEECHGPESLHNIQADSDGDGQVIVGGEFAGYGHVGRDAGPGDSDCWGCHGFGTASTPDIGPIVPTVYSSDSSVIGAGVDTAVTLTGASFTNVTEGASYVSNASLTAGDGSSVTLTPSSVAGGSLVVTIPGSTAPGNYELRAVKSGAASNPKVVTVTPKVTITETKGGATVTITGSGFGGYAAGSGTSVVGTLNLGGGKSAVTRTVEGTIVSWSDTEIEADFGSKRPDQVTVNSVFGSDTATVQQPTGRKRSK
jgi:hypothetical protein